MEAQQLPLLSLDGDRILHSNRDLPHQKDAERLLSQQNDVNELTNTHVNVVIDWEEAT